MFADSYVAHSSDDSIRPEPRFEGSNAARFAILASLIGHSEDSPTDSPSVLTAEILQRFGFNPGFSEFSPRARAGEDDDIRAAERIIGEYGQEWDPEEVRRRAWSTLNEQVDGTYRLALLAAGLGSPLERESATAATAILSSTLPQVIDTSLAKLLRFGDREIDTFRLSPLEQWEILPPDEAIEPATSWEWDGQSWKRYSSYWVRQVILENNPKRLIAALRMLAEMRTDLGRRSADPIVRELAMASRMGIGRMDRDGETHATTNTASALLPPNPEATSTMVHGTWGWKGHWWYTGGDFHDFIRDNYRSELYSDGKEFSWSGAYSDKQRDLAGDRFKRWADSEGGLKTAFGHSFGGEIIARAVNMGAQITDVVLLSAPVNYHHLSMLNRVDHVYDVRLKFDIVLTAAGARQRLPPAYNVTEFCLDLPLWSHGATHEPDLWKQHNIANVIGL